MLGHHRGHRTLDARAAAAACLVPHALAQPLRLLTAVRVWCWLLVALERDTAAGRLVARVLLAACHVYSRLECARPTRQPLPFFFELSSLVRA